MARTQRPPRRQVAAGEAIEVTVTAIGDRGDGIAESPVGRLYIPFTVTGDRLLAVPGAARGDGGAATMAELLSAGPGRAAPPCPHFGRCGGCALQHLAGGSYAAWKLQRLTQALSRAGIGGYDLAPLQITPPGSRRRATFVVTGGGGDKVFLGFNVRASHEVVDIATCLVLHPRIVDLLPPLRQLFASMSIPPPRVAVPVTLLDGGLDVVIEWPCEPDLTLRERLATFAAAADIARLSWRSSAELPVETVVQRRPVAAIFGGLPVRLPPGGFLQASAEGERALVKAVCETVAPARTVTDLFSGAGTFSLPLAAAGAQILAVDADETALQALAAAVRASPALRQAVRCERRNLLRQPVRAEELHGCEAAVFDPPRAGASAQAAELARSAVPIIAAVSCNPSSFARDARILTAAGYRLRRIVPIDQFLWSPHLELAATFTR